jgi:protein-S-isoprenylcysteine O-methyltransferase Ste14
MSRPLISRLRVPLGFLLGIVYIWFARPTWLSLFVGAAVTLVGIWIRAVASGHVKKNTELTTSGPYGYTRNPLYLGSIVIAMGFAIASLSWWIVLALALMFSLVYVPVIRNEEAFLRKTFAQFDDYCARVPRLIPRIRSAYPKAAVAWSREQYIRHREYNALIGSIFLWCVLVVKIVRPTFLQPPF